MANSIIAVVLVAIGTIFDWSREGNRLLAQIVHVYNIQLSDYRNFSVAMGIISYWLGETKWVM
jgi:hypothetical protein